MLDFFSMTPAQIDALAERHYDRMLDEYLREDPEPWDIDPPDWSDIMDMVDGMKWPEIIGIVKDYVEGDGDIMTEIFNAGVLDRFIAPEDRVGIKDPDREWAVIDRVFDDEWENDELWKEIYLWLPEEHLKKIGEHLIARADYNGIRDQYNEDHRDSYRGDWDDMG